MNAPPGFPYAGRPTAGAQWGGWAEIRADLRSSAGLVAALALVGVPAGLLWWLLAPRARYRITEDGPAVLGQPSEELLVADDAVFVLVLAATGLVCGALAWRWRRRRGVATMLALAVGGTLCGLVAWQVGELLGSGPTEVDLTRVGAVVSTSLDLASLPAIAVAPFTAVLAYVVGAMYVADDGLERTEGQSAPAPDPGVPADRAVPDLPPSRPFR